MSALIIIPTYNEKENIERIIRAALAQSEDFHVLIVDDGSPDGTANIVKHLQDEFAGRLHIKERTGKLGLGTAYLAGFTWGLERDYAYLFEMDADFSHPPEALPRLLDAVKSGKGDVAVGSRYVKGGKVVDWPWDRLVLSYGASVYVRAILWMPVKDPTAGFKCYRREVLEKIDFNKITFLGYAFQIAMKYAAYRLGYNVVEVPITFKDRELGTSKMSLNIVQEAILGVIRMRMNL